MVSEAAEHMHGLWRLVGDQWVRYQIATCGAFTSHAVKVGARLTVCGRVPDFVSDPRDSDTPSMVDCEKCSAYLLGRTR